MTTARPHAPARFAPPRPAADARRTAPPALVFEVAGQLYALPLADIREVVPMARLAATPCRPAVLDGFLNLGGVAVAVVALGRLFGLTDSPPGSHTPLLVLRHATPPVALRVYRVSHILRPADGEVVPVRDDHSFNGCVRGVAAADGRTVLFLAADLLLLDKEQQVLAEFQDREQQRLRALGGCDP